MVVAPDRDDQRGVRDGVGDHPAVEVEDAADDVLGHDLNLAARYADHLVAMADGVVVAEGPPGEVVTEDVVRGVFDLDCRVITDPVSRTPLVVPVGRHHHRKDPA